MVEPEVGRGLQTDASLTDRQPEALNSGTGSCVEIPAGDSRAGRYPAPMRLAPAIRARAASRAALVLALAPKRIAQIACQG